MDVKRLFLLRQKIQNSSLELQFLTSQGLLKCFSRSLLHRLSLSPRSTLRWKESNSLQIKCLCGSQEEFRFPHEVLAEGWLIWLLNGSTFQAALQVQLCNCRKHFLKTLPEKQKKYGYKSDCSLLNRKSHIFVEGVMHCRGSRQMCFQKQIVRQHL